MHFFLAIATAALVAIYATIMIAQQRHRARLTASQKAAEDDANRITMQIW